MNNKLSKNLISTFALLVIILSFSSAKPVLAKTYTIKTGATFTADENDTVNNNTYDYNTYNYNTYNSNQNNNTANNKLIPVITSMSSSFEILNSEEKAITINGYNFIPSSVARWDNKDRNTDYLNSRQLIIHITANDMKDLGDHSITVYNNTTNSGISNERIFTIEKDAKNSSLGANALFSGFMPSLLQWFLLLLLILLIILIIRKFLKKNKIIITISNITATSATVNVVGLNPNESYMLQATGPFEPTKIQVIADNNGMVNSSLSNLTPANHYSTTINKYDPKTKLLTNINAPVVYFETIKFA